MCEKRQREEDLEHPEQYLHVASVPMLLATDAGGARNVVFYADDDPRGRSARHHGTEVEGA